ncbi:glycosyltransferase family 39 protein [Rhodopila globiformis]|nr:glycosyltransferase family 39 protein [Rhodopila globiformis]
MTIPPIVLLIGATTLIRILFAATTGLGVDESYMVAAGRVLSLGYFDHPPAAWWLSWGAAHLFGSEHPVVVRLPFILLFAVSQLLVWRIGCLVANPRAGFWAAVALNLSPVFGITTGSWVLPDGPLDAALLGAALCLVQALPARERARGDSGWGDRAQGDHAQGDHAPGDHAPGDHAWGWWLGAGLCAGLAVFSKYTAVLTIAGAGLYLLSSRTHRRWLAHPAPYAAALVALLVFSPVLVWNATHHWASFAFQGDRAMGLRFRPFAPVATLAGEALFVLPWIWLPMMLLFAGAFRRGAPWTHHLLAWLAAPPIVLFALVSAWSSQRVLFHWAAPGYLMLFPLLGETIARHLDRRWVRRMIVFTAALELAAVATIALQMQFDWLGGSLAAVMRKDPTDEGLDWRSVRQDLDARGLLLPGGLAAAMNWRDAGKLGYALGPQTTMLCLNRDSRQFGFADPAGRFYGRDAVVLLADPSGRSVDEARRWFDSVDVLPDAAVRLDGRVLRTVRVLRGHGLHAPQ